MPDLQTRKMKRLDRKSKKDLRLLNEFRPDVIALLEQPVSPVGRWIVKITCLVMLLVLVFSYVGKLSVVSTATGVAKPVGDVVRVQMPKTSTITTVKVTEGQQIKKGKTLFTVDDEQLTHVDKRANQTLLKQAQLEKQALAAILSDKALTNVVEAVDIKNNPEIVSYYTTLSDAKQAALEVLENEKAQQNRYIAMYEFQQAAIDSEIKGAKSKLTYLSEKKSQTVAKKELERLDKQLAVKKREEANYQRKMLENAEFKGYWESAKIERENDESQIAIKKEQMADDLKEIKSQISACQASIEQLSANQSVQQENIKLYQAKADALSLQVKNTQASEKNKLSTLILDKNKEITQYQTAVNKGEKYATSQTVIAPISGTVGEIKTAELGKTLGQSQEVLTIVPNDAPLYFEVLIKNQDIGYVTVGQAVSVKVAAFPFQKKGVLEGKVTYISPESEKQENRQLMYKAKVTLADKQTKFKSDPKQVLVGMDVSVDIEIGQRRIIDFFFEPVTKYLDETFKAR